MSEGIDETVYSPDGRFVLSATGDGRIRIFDAVSAQLLLTLVGFSNNTWSAVNPAGLFDSSNLEGLSPLRWLVPDDPFNPLGIEIFTRDYFTPKLISRVFYAKAGQNGPAVTPLANLNRAQPQVQIVDVVAENGPAVTLRIRVKSGQSKTQADHTGRPLESGVFDLRVFRDGQLVGQYPSLSDDIAASDSEREAWRAQHRILETGEKIITITNVRIPQLNEVERVTFTAYAFNADRVKGETNEPVVFRLKPASKGRRRAFLITMAVNPTQAGPIWDLDLALPSAQLATKLWTQKLSRDYDVIPLTLESRTDEFGTILPNATATKANLRTVLEVLAGRIPASDAPTRALIDRSGRLDRANPDDAIILYIASHGYADPDGRFYVVPFDAANYPWITEPYLTRCRQNPTPDCRAAEDFLAHAISSDDLSAWWRGVDAGEMVMILDSCHAAAVPGRGFRPGPLGDRGFGQLSYDKGMRILAATQPDEVAKATNVGRLGHTLLTEALRTAWHGQQSETVSAWLRETEQQLPQRAKQLYPELKNDLQLPELMDFRSRKTPTLAGRTR
jgi:hypothetical protein